MHDFNEIFKEQLATEKPYTEGMVRSAVHLYAHSLTAKELMAKSKQLKTKIGKKRLLYCVTAVGVGGKPLKEKIEKVWEDEFDLLQVKLQDFNFTGYDGKIPQFSHKDIK